MEHYYRFIVNNNKFIRIEQIIDWLKLPEPERPQFLTLYFSLIDDVGHNYGPDSEEMKDAVHKIDNDIGILMKKISVLNFPVNLIIVSDHGMSALDQDNPIYLEDFFNPDELIVVHNESIIMFHHHDSLIINRAYETLLAHANQYRVFKRDNIPEYLHFGKNQRVGDLLLIPNPPYVFRKRPSKASPGTHGFDPYQVRDMGAIFYAWGPAFKKGYSIKSFENIHVFPIIAKILELDYDIKSIDGKIQVLENILRN